MKKIMTIVMLAAVLSTASSTAFAGTTGRAGKVTPKSVGAGALSLLVWPGIGQAVNEQKDEKVITHAVLGLTGIFRFFSCYDAVVNRKGGYWENRI